jgi:hypothetical protein
MDKQNERMDKQNESTVKTPAVEICALGKASEVTRGMPTLYPYYEANPPPFDRYYP